MKFLDRFSRRARLVTVQLGLLGTIVWASVLAERQSALLPHQSVIAAPVPTPPSERDLELAPSIVPDSGEAPVGPTGVIPDVTPTAGPEVPAPVVPRATVIDDSQYYYAENFYAPQIQAYLDSQPGPLKGISVAVGSRQHTFAEILASQTSLYSLNPQVVLALIEQQSGIVTQANVQPERVDWALDFRGDEGRWRGIIAQTRWAVRELHHAQRDFSTGPELTYVDGSHSAVPAGFNVGDYGVARVLAATTTADQLAAKLDGGPNSFIQTFKRLWGDPRDELPSPHTVAAPFMTLPLKRAYPISSFFDHETPFLRENGTIVTYRGDRADNLSYDGHDGWDYAAMAPTRALAAASGAVVFAGNSDDGCGIALAVIIDHGNGYRTLYWHLDEILVDPGPVEGGAEIGVVGSSGCSTGPHLHFQTQFLGRDTNPYGWCGPQGQDPWANHPAGQISTWLWASAPSPCGLPADAVVVEPGDPVWRNRGSGWEELGGGIGGSAMLAPSVRANRADIPLAVWMPPLTKSGRYRVITWIPYIVNLIEDSTSVRYLVRHMGGEDAVVVDQEAAANSWVDLGTYDFDPGQPSFVGLAAVDEALGTNVWFDTMLWIPVD
jgi:murein DD-endopeptidase MepM/ murein hydrolase activator NlpD